MERASPLYLLLTGPPANASQMATMSQVGPSCMHLAPWAPTRGFGQSRGQRLFSMPCTDPNSFDEFEAPEWCVPIKANVLDFEWDALAEACQFDIISMDPPWQLASHAPTRGVAIGYQQLPDLLIETLPIEKLQTNGFIFIWVINNKYAKAFDLMTKWGYEYVDDITWVKQTVNRRMAKGHGYYLQHAKETCLVGRKGNDPPGCRHGVASDVIFSERRGQSQKPEEIYLMMEELVPNGKYLEIFGRKNNLRDYWITIGNEL
ncbi:MT-A70-domain-containing protein [Entophlyctis helioformis]|nr:MT-A70-domain-containing protein [Entophlyctis helioformis]